MHRAIVVSCAVMSMFGFAGCGGDDDAGTPQPSPTTVTTTPEAEAEVVRPSTPDFVAIVVKGTISGGERKEVALGTTVRLQVVGDTTDEVHLHGYDKTVDIAPGRPGNLTFKADVPGIFEVELEKRGLKLMDLVVK